MIPDYDDPSYWLGGEDAPEPLNREGRYVPLVIVYSPWSRRRVPGTPTRFLWLAWIRARLLALWHDITIPAEEIGIGWAVFDREAAKGAQS